MIAELLVANGFATAVFTSLAASDAHAAHQKSAILQALRSVFSAPSAFLEEDSRWDVSLEPDKIHHRVVLRCIECPPAVDAASESINPESVRYRSADGSQDSFTLYFDTYPASQSWQVSGKVERIHFAPATKRMIPSGETVSANDFQIVACSIKRRCNGVNSFETHRDAVSFSNSLSGMVSRRSLPNQKFVAKDDFIAPLIVKRGSEVNVSLSSDSGLQIQARAIALESGATGDRIQLRLMLDRLGRASSNTQIVTGRISETGEVRYEK